MAQCSKRIYSSNSIASHLCSRQGKVEVDGKWFCKQHSPDAVKKRKAKQDERYQQWKVENDAKLERIAYNSKAGDACRALGIEDPAAALAAARDALAYAKEAHYWLCRSEADEPCNCGMPEQATKALALLAPKQ